LIDPKNLRIKVQGVRIQTKNDKKEGFIKREGFMDYSNVKLVEGAPASTKKKPAKKSAKGE
jgi:large subunit ribosomal protein L24